MTLKTSLNKDIFENNIDEEDILDIDDDDEDELPEEDIDDGEETLDNFEEDINEDEDEDEEEEDKDVILDDLDDLINNIEEEENEETEEKISDKRTTFSILTKYEKNFILGFRTQQIINGSVILIDINKLKEKSAYNIALEELKQKKIPFKIKRTLPNGKIEIWDLEELIIL